MSYPYSDEDSLDSDSGIRFKTANTRHHVVKSFGRVRTENNHPRRRNRSRSRSRSRERSNKREDRLKIKTKEYRRNRHRSRSPDKYEKYRRHGSKSNSEKYERTKEKTSFKDNHEDVIVKDVPIKEVNVKSVHVKDVKVKETTTKDVIAKDEYGPKLPPKRETPSTSTSQKNNGISEDDEFLGPALPPSMKQTIKHPEPEQKQNPDSEEDVYGPSLPPPISIKPQTRDKSIVIGPTLPPNLKAALIASEAIVQDLPNSNTDEKQDDDDIVGPLPEGHSSTNPNFMKLEERALEIKLNGLNKPDTDTKAREEWMLELPGVHTANLGLGPRQFRAKGVPDMSDRSSWTDTPQDKQNKAKNKHKSSSPKTDIKKEAELEHLKQRDLEQQSIVEKHKKKKKRDKSLLDIHQEKINKKKKEENKDQVRRPFSRDIDLKANHFDEAQKKSILKKAQLLDNRFSSGESKFL